MNREQNLSRRITTTLCIGLANPPQPTGCPCRNRLRMDDNMTPEEELLDNYFHHKGEDYVPLYIAQECLERARKEIRLTDFINAASIGAADMPHVVVQKLQAAIDAENG